MGLGGAQQVIRHIVAASDASSYEYLVYAGHDGVFRPDIEAAGAVVRVVPRRLRLFDPFWLAALSRQMRRDRIEVVHTHLFGDNLHGYLAARLAGDIPVIMTLHNTARHFRRTQLLAYRWLIPRSERAVACAPSALEAFKEMFGEHARSMIVIPNGLPEEEDKLPAPAVTAGLRRELGIPDGARVVVALGRMVAQKAFSDLISAFARVAARGRRDARLVLLGEGEERAALERQAAREGVGELVLFPGFRNDARSIVAASDVLAFSSLYEGLPVALLEGMAASRCIVATAAPGLREVLTNERTALLVPLRDPDAMAKALERALSDTALRERLGAAARACYLAEYTADTMARRYEAVYAQLARGDSSVAANLSEGTVTR